MSIIIALSVIVVLIVYWAIVFIIISNHYKKAERENPIIIGVDVHDKSSLLSNQQINRRDKNESEG